MVTRSRLAYKLGLKHVDFSTNEVYWRDSVCLGNVLRGVISQFLRVSSRPPRLAAVSEFELRLVVFCPAEVFGHKVPCLE